MDAISPEIRLDPAAKFVAFEPDDWLLDPERPILHHRPTHTLFCIVIPEAVHEPISVFDVAARLSHVCDGHEVPDAKHMTALGRGAIAAYLHAIGFWPAAIEQLQDDIPF